MSARGLAHPVAVAAPQDKASLPAKAATPALAALFLFGLALRLADLDRIPLGEGEARQALAALGLMLPERAIGSVGESPLLSAAQALLFSLFGASEATARLPVALVGALLPLAPPVFCDVLGRGRSVALSLLLAASPILLLASRQSETVVLSLALLAGALWAGRRYLRTREESMALAATATLCALVLLAGPGGPVLALQVALALGLAHWSRQRDRSPPEQVATLGDLLRQWPFGRTLPAALLIAFLVATLFMLNPGGLAAVGDLLQATLTGFGVSGDFLTRLSLVIAWEPLALAAAAANLLSRRGRGLADGDRFLLFWLLTSLLSLLLWRGAGPAHALWLMVPLAGLAAGMLQALLEAGESRHDRPAWSVLPAAAIGVALLAMVGFFVQLLIRNSAQPLQGLAGLALLPALLTFAWWRPRESLLRGAMAGAIGLALLASLGGGQVMAAGRAEEVDGLWRVTAPSQDIWLLQDTLQDLADRDNGGVPGLEIGILREDRSLLLWLLRDQTALRRVERVQDANEIGILLLPQGAEPPADSGAWIGQDFTIERHLASDAGIWPGPDFAASGGRLVLPTRYALWLQVEKAAPLPDNDPTQVTLP